ncbi:MAG: 4Fe-4S cluster-binding domain-containing protein, partial [Prevotellaceae bacterium]|nr:4Fe-4S cluster-binding domain-containing protein [Prevotellaceae bacterium]
LVSDNPTSLTISPTHKCSAACYNCCLSCSPNIKHIMPFKRIKSHIDEALQTYPSIKIVILTGGECFLLGKDLERVIEYIREKGRLSRVVTNAYWAKDYDSAVKKLSTLKTAGLTEFNISTGDNHQQFVPFQYVANAIEVALFLNISPVVIAIEAHPNSKFTRANIEQIDKFKESIENKKITIIEGAWMNFVNNADNIPDNKICTNVISGRCEYLFHGITINPYSQMLACCGLTVEYNPYLKLGDLTRNTLADLHEKQFEDLFKLWLYVDGPKHIYECIQKKKKSALEKFPHKCAYCMEIIKNEENISILKTCIKKELPSILSRINLLKAL